MTRDDLNEMIKEIVQNGGFTESELSIIRKAVNGFLDRCHGKYMYYDFFSIATGKKYGDAIETKIMKSFNGFVKPVNDTSFDAWTKDREKVEIKSLRACAKGRTHIFLKDEQVSPSRFSTSSYQQTKPSCCDWFIFHILYGDGSRLFVIPSSMISKHPGEDRAEQGKIPLSKQHRDHDTEGQVNIGQVIKYAKYFEIENYDLEATYEFAVFQEEIKRRMTEIGWQLSE